ncbi:MAG: hypothetical protein KBD42_14010, partial [Chitinophagales bacterium]|nr:hypothetical protein [Chitinophagales bacterium]
VLFRQKILRGEGRNPTLSSKEKYCHNITEIGLLGLLNLKMIHRRVSVVVQTKTTAEICGCFVN